MVRRLRQARAVTIPQQSRGAFILEPLTAATGWLPAPFQAPPESGSHLAKIELIQPLTLLFPRLDVTPYQRFVPPHRWNKV